MTAQQVLSIDQNDVDPYSPTRLIAAADAKVAEGDVQGAELLFKEALLDWVDDAREGTGDPMKMRNAIADLWCGFATFYFNLKKYKSCLDAYENGTQCPISGSCGKIWRAYANYCRVRNRPRSAQKVYLRALAGGNPSDKGAVTDETERFKLWNDFLSLTRETTNDPTLTIDALMTAVREEHSNTQQDSQPNTTNQTNSQQSLDQSHQRPTKIQKLNHIENNFTTPAIPGTSITTHASNDIKQLTSISNPQDLASYLSISNQTQPAISMTDQIQIETNRLISLTQGNMPPELLAVWLATDGDTSPSRPEPPLFGPSPPKLSDFSGKDVLGSGMALELLRILKNPKEGNIVLDVCRGCWTMTALKEQEVAKTIKYFEEKMNTELDTLEANLAERLSVSSPALELTVKQTNAAERNQVMSTWNHRKQQLVNAISWEFRRLLAIQQNILTSANIPGFNGTSIDPAVIDLQSKVCSVMHSAFFLRNRIDEKTHITMLSKQEEKLSKEAVTPPPPSVNGPTQTQFNVPPQLRQNLPPPPFAQAGLPPPPPPHMYASLQQTMYPPHPPIPPPIGIPPPGLPPPNTVTPAHQLPPHIQNQQTHFR